MIWPFRQKQSSVNTSDATYFYSPNLKVNERTLRSYFDEGYGKNPIVHRCVNEIALNASIIPIHVVNAQGTEVENSPLGDLIKRPNSMTQQTEFIKQLFVDYLIAGNSYNEVIRNNAGVPIELWRLNPVKMTVQPGQGMVPSAYIYCKGSKDEKSFPVDPLTGETEILHRKTVNPLDPWYGLPPMASAALSGDIVNDGLTWNHSLLNNGARLSGALTVKGASLSEEAANRMKQMIKQMWTGKRNAGEMPLLYNGLEYQELGKTPRDMDFNTSLNVSNIYIAMVYGVPLPLISIDAATYNNVESAQEKLFEDTVIPLFDEFIGAMNHWLSPMFGDRFFLAYSLDDVPALEAKRARKFKRMTEGVQAGIFTRDEAREKLGLDVRGGNADELLVPANNVPVDMVTGVVQAQQGTEVRMFEALLQAGNNNEDAVQDMKSANLLTQDIASFIEGK